MLMEAINKYTNHKARCINIYRDYFDYGYDIVLNQETFEEAASLANTWADFYHFGSYIFNWPGVDFNKLANPGNCCIKYYGSYLRDNGQKCKEFHDTTGIKAITGTDWSITSLLGQSFYHLSSYFARFGDTPVDEIPKCEIFTGKTLKICASSAGHPKKGYQVLVDVINELIKDGFSIELDVISGISNDECLKRKRACHLNFGSLHGGWGLSGVESMFMGQPTLTCLDPFVLSIYPNQPSILVNNKETLKDAIKSYFLPDAAREWYLKSILSTNFANTTFRWREIIRRYMYVIDLIRNGDRYQQGGQLPEVIYE